MYPPNATAVHQALDRFLESREGARRFHASDIGRNIDPNYCLADWLSLARGGDGAAIKKRYWSKVEKSIMEESSASQGGYTVPPDLSLGLMCDLSTGSLFRRLGAYVQPMRTLTHELPLPDVSTPQTAGTAPYFGGFFMQWLAESAKFPATGMQFRNVQLTAWTLGGYVYASNTFLDDAVGVESWLVRLFGAGAAWYQDLAFFQGSGTGQPMGVVPGPGSKTVTRGTAGTVSVGDAQNMMGVLLPSAIEHGAVWFCHPTVLPKMTAFSGWIPNGPLMLHGLPVVPTGKCSTLGTKGDLVLAVPSLYVIGDRLQFEVAFGAEEPTAWKNNQSALRVYSRVAGQSIVSAPITLPDATSTVSPFVVLV